MKEVEFKKFGKIARLSRRMVVTEKIDGTNGVIWIGEGEGEIKAGSRNRWLSLESDNFGFCKWVLENREELRGLGRGYHYGEWWGKGIQRGYGLEERRFSLFNVGRWHRVGEEPRRVPTGDPRQEKWTQAAPACCHVVPVLAEGVFSTWTVLGRLVMLHQNGSVAAPGFMKPEGVVVYHSAGNVLFKATIEGDDEPKSAL